MNRKTLRYSSLFAMALTFVLGGCMSAEERVGWVPAEQAIGESMNSKAFTGRVPTEQDDATGDTSMSTADLTYVDGKGTRRSLDHLFKDYTLLLFTSSDQEDRAEQVREMERIVASQWSAWYVKVAGVDVHTSPDGCGDKADWRLVANRYNLSSLCDEAGVVRAAYQVGDESDMLLLHRDGTILASASTTGIDGLKARLAAEVRYLDDSRAMYEDIP